MSTPCSRKTFNKMLQSFSTAYSCTSRKHPSKYSSFRIFWRRQNLCFSSPLTMTKWKMIRTANLTNRMLRLLAVATNQVCQIGAEMSLLPYWLYQFSSCYQGERRGNVKRTPFCLSFKSDIRDVLSWIDPYLWSTVKINSVMWSIAIQKSSNLKLLVVSALPWDIGTRFTFKC